MTNEPKAPDVAGELARLVKSASKPYTSVPGELAWLIERDQRDCAREALVPWLLNHAPTILTALASTDAMRAENEQLEMAYAATIAGLDAQRLAALAENVKLREALAAIDNELGPASDWVEAREELLTWTGSAFLAGEKVRDAAGSKGNLYSFLCGKIGYFMAAEAACDRARSALTESPSHDH